MRSAYDRMEHAAADMRLDVAMAQLRRALNAKYRPDQPRAPRGVPIGGQWIDDLRTPQGVSDYTQVAAGRPRGPRCDGLSDGCQNGGSFGSSGIVKPMGTDRRLCWDCAIKWLGAGDLTREQQLEMVRIWDKTYQP